MENKQQLNIVENLILDHLSKIRETLDLITEEDYMKSTNQMIEGEIIKWLETRIFKKKDGSEGHILKFRIEDSKKNYYDLIAWDRVAQEIGGGDYPIGSKIKVYCYRSKSSDGNELTVKDFETPTSKASESKYMSQSELLEISGTKERGDECLVLNGSFVRWTSKQDCVYFNNKWYHKLTLLEEYCDGTWLAGKLRHTDGGLLPKQQVDYRINFLIEKLAKKYNWELKYGTNREGSGDNQQVNGNITISPPTDPAETCGIHSESSERTKQPAKVVQPTLPNLITSDQYVL